MKTQHINLVLFLLLTSSLTTFAASQKRITLRINDLVREAIVIQPDQQDQQQKSSLLMFYHGGNGSSEKVLNQTKLDEYADENNLVIILPDGSVDPNKEQRYWNDGRYETSHLADDKLFTKILVSQAIRNFNVDAKRVFAGGISNGGLFTSRLICEMKDTFLGFIKVAANMPVDLAKTCAIDSPVNVLMINGTADTFMKYEGGTIPSSRKLGLSGEVIGTDETLDKYVSASKCKLSGKNFVRTQTFNKDWRDKSSDDGIKTDYRRYYRCEENSYIEFFKVHGGQHGYPTPRIENNPAGIDIETSDEIIRFINNRVNASSEIDPIVDEGPIVLSRTVSDGKDTRTYNVYLPADYENRIDTLPVVFGFHPARSSANGFADMTILHEQENAQDYIIVYPNGMENQQGQAWNAGFCCTKGADVAFFDAILADLGTLTQIQPKVFLTGFSSGAMMVYKLICDRSYNVAAAVTFGAYLRATDIRTALRCPWANNVPLLHIHGSEDTQMDPNGQENGYNMGIETTPLTTYMNIAANRNGGQVLTSEYYSKDLDSVVVKLNENTSYTIIEGLGHTWPGAEAFGIYGPGRPELPGSTFIMNFFNDEIGKAEK